MLRVTGRSRDRSGADCFGPEQLSEDTDGGAEAGVTGQCLRLCMGAMPGLDAVGQLAILKVKVKFGTEKGIEKALTLAAEREGLPRDEIEELAVPSYGLEEVGSREEKFGEYTAKLLIDGSDARLLWSNAQAKALKSVPAVVKEKHVEEFKELQAAQKDIARMLPAQRDRIDNLFLEQMRWPLATWKERYLDHPLVGTLARRLIWNFVNGKSKSPGMFGSEGIVNSRGKPLKLTDEFQVELWHPIDATTEEVLAWARGWRSSRFSNLSSRPIVKSMY